MRRALALALALCCVLAPVALGAPASRPTDGAPVGSAAPQPATDTTSFLRASSGSIETAAHRDAAIDVSGTLAIETTRLDGRFRRQVLDERFSATDSVAARRERIEAVATRIDARIATLTERQATTVTAYNNGSLSGHEFLRDLARIDATAARIEASVGRLAELADQSSIAGLPADSWARNRALRLDPLRGPVRTRIASALRGENTVPVDDDLPSGVAAVGTAREERLAPLLVYVETTPDGVVLATVDDEQYYREAYLPGERNATGDGVGNATDVRDRRAALYPWAENNSEFKSQRTVQRAGISRFRFSHDHGRLTAYLDQDSGEVFAEHQRKTLSRLPTAAPVNTSDESRRLVVNRTHPSGPMEVSLTSESGTPLDGTVRIGNRSIGDTGRDGRLWTVAPRGNVTITARVNGSTMRIETSAAVANRTRLATPVSP
ncbi:DUF7096 domain-containing protein [Halococcus agarilyticus]|uniref:DUF7096 domain-containing protein n=1 Tax=Halococcus agarilyticus TaxID=1232219 RepID=UPI000677EE99|nr:hypothetical protein [Halococcus agarilyticus]